MMAVERGFRFIILVIAASLIGIDFNNDWKLGIAVYLIAITLCNSIEFAGRNK